MYGCWVEQALDKSNLTIGDRQILKRAAEDATSKPYPRVVANGHTDTAGPAQYNFGLSQRRADSVAQALQSLGVAGVTIERNAFGKSKPRVATGDGVPEPQNRRAEILTQR
jgi:outer membrane protein OmpA-like peptidoglycan-associated protein